jgi:hypothetical protein
MTNFETQHFYVIVKEELGIVLAECIRHNPPDYIIGTRNLEYVDVVERFTDKQQAEKVYRKLLFDRKKDNLRNT